MASVRRLHHIGVVVDNIERHGARYAQHLSLQPLASIVTDAVQEVQVQEWGLADQTSLELIEPLGDGSPIRRFLDKGGGLHHLCFEVDDVVTAVKDAEAGGGLCVCQPVPAAAFDSRRIAFLFFADLGLIEFLEASRS